MPWHVATLIGCKKVQGERKKFNKVKMGITLHGSRFTVHEIMVLTD
jgi:hypothetical protein